MDGFFDLFEDSEEYPQNVADRGVPEEMLYCYISSTFLNGFINYVKVIKAVVVERYTCDEDCHCGQCLAWDSPQFHEKMKPLTSGFHCNWSCAPDDVWVLAETDGHYWFFWYDRDCSDCAIGRASKAGAEAKGITRDAVVAAFDKSSRYHIPYTKGRTFDFTISCKGWLGG